MKWEDLSVYRPVKRENLKSTYGEFTKIIGDELHVDGFELRVRKLIRQSDDLFHIIHVDTRGSWMGISDRFKTELSICSVYDTDTFVLGKELTASRKIEDLVPKIRNHGRITQEYSLLANFLVRKIRESILPYFSQYKSSKDVLENLTRFRIDNLSEITERNANLILYCELANGIDLKSSEILTNRLVWLEKIDAEDIMLKKTEMLLTLTLQKKWEEIKEVLIDNKRQVFKKLKIKEQ